MNAQSEVRKLVHQTQRYEFSDGLRDLQWALVMITIGITTWVIFDNANAWVALSLDLNARFGDFGVWVLGLLLIVVPWVPALATLLVMRYIRQRYLWRESGYVESKRWMVSRSVMLGGFVIVMLALALGAWLQIHAPPNEMFLFRVIIVAGGWSTAYILVQIGRQFDLPRYVWVGIIGSLTTAVLLFLPITVGQMGLVWGLIWGGLLVISGYRPLREAIRNASESHHE
jgi:hypothetical protein